MPKISLSKSSYNITPAANGALKVEVTPVALWGPLRLVIGGLISLFLLPFYGLGLLVAAAYYYIAFVRNRKFSEFTVDPKGVHLSSGETIDAASIIRLYIAGPEGPDVEVSYSNNLGGLAAAKLDAVQRKSEAARSWRLMLEAKGREYVLANGMQEVTARAVMHEIGKPLGWKLK